MICINSIADTLPQLGTPVANILSPAQRKALGIQFNYFIHRYINILGDPLISEYVNHIEERMLPYADLAGQPVHVYVANNAAINAFAGPSGHIVLNSGIILLTENESELASVLAHETGHLTHNHILQKIAQQKQMSWATIAGTLAAIAIAASGNPAATTGAIAAVASARTQYLVSHTRIQEKEADSTAVRLMVKAGFDPMMMAKFFERMKSQSFNNGESFMFLRTHPLTKSRIAATEELASQYNISPKLNSLDYYLAKERVRVLTAKPGPNLESFYKNKLKQTNTLDAQKKAYKYGYSTLLAREGQYDKAIKISKSLYKQNPNNLFFITLYTDSLFLDGKTKESISILKDKYKIYPDNIILILNYADNLIESKQAAKSIPILKQAINNNPTMIDLWALLAEAYHKSGSFQHYHEALATTYALSRQWVKANVILKQLLKNKKLSEDSIQRVKDKIKRYENQKEKWNNLVGKPM